MTAIIEALQKLDVTNDNHWTADGLPRIDTVKMLAGDQSLTRDIITAAAPGFSRASGDLTAPATNTSETPQNAQTQQNNLPTPQETQPELQAQAETLVEVHSEIEVEWETLHAEAVAEVNEANKKLNEAKQVLHEANAKLDIVVSNAPDNAKETTTETIQGYLQAQQKLAEEKANAHLELQKSGVDLNQVRELLGQAENIKTIVGTK